MSAKIISLTTKELFAVLVVERGQQPLIQQKLCKLVHKLTLCTLMKRQKHQILLKSSDNPNFTFSISLSHSRHVDDLCGRTSPGDLLGQRRASVRQWQTKLAKEQARVTATWTCVNDDDYLQPGCPVPFCIASAPARRMHRPTSDFADTMGDPPRWPSLTQHPQRISDAPVVFEEESVIKTGSHGSAHAPGTAFGKSKPTTMQASRRPGRRSHDTVLPDVFVGRIKEGSFSKRTYSEGSRPPPHHPANWDRGTAQLPASTSADVRHIDTKDTLPRPSRLAAHAPLARHPPTSSRPVDLDLSAVDSNIGLTSTPAVARPGLHSRPVGPDPITPHPPVTPIVRDSDRRRPRRASHTGHIVQPSHLDNEARNNLNAQILADRLVDGPVVVQPPRAAPSPPPTRHHDPLDTTYELMRPPRFDMRVDSDSPDHEASLFHAQARNASPSPSPRDVPPVTNGSNYRDLLNANNANGYGNEGDDGASNNNKETAENDDESSDGDQNDTLQLINGRVLFGDMPARPSMGDVAEAVLHRMSRHSGAFTSAEDPDVTIQPRQSLQLDQAAEQHADQSLSAHDAAISRHAHEPDGRSPAHAHNEQHATQGSDATAPHTPRTPRFSHKDDIDTPERTPARLLHAHSSGHLQPHPPSATTPRMRRTLSQSTAQWDRVRNAIIHTPSARRFRRPVPKSGVPHADKPSCPPMGIRLYVATWNLNEHSGAKDVERLLFPNGQPDEDDEEIDVYVIGLQEAPLENLELELCIQQALGPAYTKICGAYSGPIQMVIFSRMELNWFITQVETDKVATKLGGMMRTKGGVGISLMLSQRLRLLFVCAHLAAHQDRVKERNENAWAIRRGLKLPERRLRQPENLNGTAMSLNTSARLSHDVARYHDIIFWLGDLNYRINCSRDLVEYVLAHNDMDHLLARDQLNVQRAAGDCFSDFEEAPITFLPTFKYDVGTNNFDTSAKQRIPAWCDRVLWQCAEGIGAEVTCEAYNSIPAICSSDHKPVFAQFELSMSATLNNEAEQEAEQPSAGVAAHDYDWHLYSKAFREGLKETLRMEELETASVQEELRRQSHDNVSYDAESLSTTADADVFAPPHEAEAKLGVPASLPDAPSPSSTERLPSASTLTEPSDTVAVVPQEQAPIPKLKPPTPKPTAPQPRQPRSVLCAVM